MYRQNLPATCLPFLAIFVASLLLFHMPAAIVPSNAQATTGRHAAVIGAAGKHPSEMLNGTALSDPCGWHDVSGLMPDRAVYIAWPHELGSPVAAPILE